MEPKQNPCPPHKIRHQDGFRRPVRLAGADGAPLRQLRASRAWRCKAQSRSRPGRPWRFCPDRLHPFLLYCLVESVPLEPNQNPCLLASVQMVPKQSPYPPHKIRHQDGFRQPIRLAGADGAPLPQLRASRALPKAGQGEVALGVFSQTGSVPSSCILWLNLCRWNPTRTHVPPSQIRRKSGPSSPQPASTSVGPSVWQELMVRLYSNCVIRGLRGARPEVGRGQVDLGVFAQTSSIPSSCIAWLNLCSWNQSVGPSVWQLRDSRASRREARSRSRPGRPWRLCLDQLNCFLLYCLVASVQMEPKQNPCPPHRIRHQDGFRRPVRLAGADGAPLRQLRASRAWRCKAQSRSRPGRPWRFCPDRLHPFLLCCFVESVPMEPQPEPMFAGICADGAEAEPVSPPQDSAPRRLPSTHPFGRS